MLASYTMSAHSILCACTLCCTYLTKPQKHLLHSVPPIPVSFLKMLSFALCCCVAVCTQKASFIYSIVANTLRIGADLHYLGPS